MKISHVAIAALVILMGFVGSWIYYNGKLVKIESQMNVVTQQTRLMIEERLTSITTELEKNVSNSAHQAESSLISQKDLAKSFESFRSEMLDILARAAEAPRMLKDTPAPAIAAALQALDKGNESLKAGQAETALLYFLNGINHDPKDMKLLKTVTELANSSDNPDVKARAQTALELASYQVSPGDVETVLALITSIQAKEGTPSKQAVSITDLEKQAEMILKATNPNFCWANLSMIIKNVKDVEDILGALESIDAQNPKLSDLNARLQTLRTTEDALRTCESADNCMRLLKIEAGKEKPNSLMVETTLLVYNRFVSELFGKVGNDLPDAMNEHIKLYPTQIVQSLDTIRLKLSQSSYDKAMDYITKAKKYAGKNNYETIKVVTANLNEARLASSEISHEGLRQQVEREYAKATERIPDLRKAQYKAYQKWAVSLCDNAWTTYDKTRIVTKQDAFNIFSNNRLQTIDSSLIAPEVARCYENIVSKLFSQLDGASVFNFEKTMSIADKKTLDDF